MALNRVSRILPSHFKQRIALAASIHLPLHPCFSVLLNLRSTSSLSFHSHTRHGTRLRRPIIRNRHVVFSSQNTSFSDPVRPDIFYHLVDPPTPVSSNEPAYVLSFLSSPPPCSNSRTIVGWLSAASIDAPFRPEFNDFKENPGFRDILHKAIQEGLHDEVDAIHVNGALQLQQGWMHIHDERNIPPLGRIGDPDDILATVLVRDSKVVPETYQPMPSYRLRTSDGFTQLTPGLAQRLRTILTEEVESEQRRK